MPIDIRQEPATPATLLTYAKIPSAFEVSCRFEIAGGGPGRWTLIERAVTAAYSKDYDAIDGGPNSWPRRFDLTGWAVFVARDGCEQTGGAVVASVGSEALAGVADEPVLWDVRVAAGVRRNGVGSALLQAAERLCVDRGHRALWVETQDVNVPACRFYARHGYVLARVEHGAYAELPEEIRLIWRRDVYA